jgi:hypothetical protein
VVEVRAEAKAGALAGGLAGAAVEATAETTMRAKMGTIALMAGSTFPPARQLSSAAATACAADCPKKGLP